MSYNTKNYTEQGGDVTHFGGKVIFEEGSQIEGLPQAENLASNATTAQILSALKNAGIMVPDTWNLSVLGVPTKEAMPTEETGSNSGHATVSIEDNGITIALDCEVKDLADANHGEIWGTHKWLGFGIRTGLASVVGVKFTDDTGAEATLGSLDADEATALGLSAGDFVLYIKAEQTEYLSAKKHFTLWADGCSATSFTLRITETKPVT